MWKWGEWLRRPGIAALGLGLAWLLGLLLIVAAISSLWQSEALQEQLDREHALKTAQAAVATVLVSGGGVAELQGTVSQLLSDDGLGFKSVSVRALGGIELARAGAYDALALPLLSSPVNGRFRESLYEMAGDRVEVPVMSEGRTLATLDLVLVEPTRRVVHDEAVARLRWFGIVGLALSLPLVLLLFVLSRRGAVMEPRWAHRLRTAVRDTPPASDDAVQQLPAEIDSLSQLSYAMISVTRDARVRDMNLLAAQMTGWAQADAIGRLIYSVFHPLGLDDEPLVTPVERALHDKEPVPPEECRLRARDGVVRHVETMATLTRDEGGGVDGAVLMFRDIGARQKAIEDIRRQSRLTHGIIDHLVEGVLTTDAAGVIRFANLRAMRMFGYTRDELAGATMTKLMPVPFLNTPGIRLSDYLSSAQRSKLPRVVGWRKDATTFPVELLVEAMVLPGEGAREDGHVIIVRDITDRLKSDNLSLRLGRLLDSAAEEVYVFDAQSLYLLDVNKSARRNLGFRIEQLSRMTPLQLAPDMDPEAFYGHLSRLRGLEDENVVYRTAHQRIDGSSYPVEVRLSYSRDEEPPVYMALVSDITERQAAEERLQHLAHNDALTGLPNRPVLHDRLAQAVLLTQRSRRLLGVMFVDLDRFKAINDNYGHEAGDHVLQMVAERLRASVRGSDTVARLAGDEFVVLMPGLNEPGNAEVLAQKMVEAFRRPMSVDGYTLVVTVSIGVTVYPADESDPESLLRHADQAMFEAKKAGRAGYKMFAADTSAETARRIVLERDLNHAAALDQLRLRYEPLYAAARDELVAMRLSTIWQHGTYGEIGESETLQLAAHIGEVERQLLWQLQRHGQFYAGCRGNRPVEVPVIIDMLDWQLHDAGLCSHMLDVMQRYAVPPMSLIVGCSEAALADNAVMPQPGFSLLRGAGVRFCVNEVGNGANALNTLGNLPADFVSLAPACIAGLPANENASATAKAVMAMAKRHNKRVIASGLTHPAQRDMLAALGGAWVAGPVLGEPIAVDDTEQFLAQFSVVGGGRQSSK